MFYFLPYILGTLAILIVFACLGYHTYMAVKHNNGLSITSKKGLYFIIYIIWTVILY